MQRIAEAAGPQIELLDCPISGGRPRAVDGTLSAIVAGPAALVERVRPLLDVLASQVFVVGAQAGQAQVCKIANNAISISGMVVACEAVVMGAKAGLDPAVMIDVINASTGRNSATVDKFPRAILPRSFDYGGPIAIGSKDLGLYIEEARAQQVSALAVSNAAQLWSMAVDRFGERADMTNFIRLLEEWAGLGEDGRPCR
ncbi:MAG: NAD(P)-dependent oxidoreductase, partial [Variovorax sp.]